MGNGKCVYTYILIFHVFPYLDYNGGANIKSKLITFYREQWCAPPYIWRWRLLGIWIVAFTVAYGSIILSNREQIRKEKITRIAICSFTHNLRTRVRDSENFIKENPKGIPGIPIAVLQKSISDQKQTLKSLSIANCKEHK